MHSQKYILNQLQTINKKYISTGIEIVGLFGSVARDENRDDSDIDILYKTKQGIENLYDKN